ncbi:hypothetical protein TSUD_409500 [Trifolium subterraneum]|uniref:NAB domain-containing protein n=1 Tax=Trifolium subterraneum TaxID=3900 RepID=A0A2Z6PH69_TRISU|nr:hypothetical protein TSUD_409500 [Trifolium subterraneum]
MEDSSNSNVGCNGEIVSVTPSKKRELLQFELLSLHNVLHPNCDGDNSSVSSANEGCESPLSSWDSEPETDIPSLINCDGTPEGSLQSINLEENYLDMEEQNQFVGVENTDDGLLWEMDNRSYEDLLNKFLEKEEELRVSNYKLQFSEEEIINSEAQLDNMCEELKLKDEELNKQKELSEEKIFKLKIQIEKSENRLNNVNGELKLKEEELKIQKELLKRAIFCSKLHIEKSNNRLNYINEELKLKEEELNKQKELSEEEIFKLKTQIEKSEIQLNNVNEVLKLKEEELNVQKDLSEQEIIKLKIQVENSEVQLKNVHEELKQKEEELNKLKEFSEEENFKLKIQIEKSANQLNNVHEELNRKQEEMQKQIAEYDTHISEFVNKITSLAEQLDVAHENLKISKDEITILRMELESKSSETNLLQGQLKVTERTQNQMLGDLVKMHEANEINQEQEMRKLKSENLDLQAKLCFDIASLSKQNIELTSKLEGCDSRNKELVKKLKQYEAEKLNQLELHATQIVLQDEIMSLRQELKQRMDDAEATNKKLDMVMIELDEANVMIGNLKAEICSRDDTALDEVNNLKLRVEELENKVTRQNGVISEWEKKEAVRELQNLYDSKVEHCKIGYRARLFSFLKK